MIWILTLLSLIGVVLNIQKKRVCFIFWGFTNLAWACVDFYKRIPEQAWLFVIYTVLAVIGWFSWRENGKRG